MISYESFKNAMARVVIYSHPKLDSADQSSVSGDQRPNKDKVKDLVQKRENMRKALQQQILAEMRQEFDAKFGKGVSK